MSKETFCINLQKNFLLTDIQCISQIATQVHILVIHDFYVFLTFCSIFLYKTNRVLNRQILMKISFRKFVSCLSLAGAAETKEPYRGP